MRETFNFTQDDVFSEAEPVNSPNVPFNDWVFKTTADGSAPVQLKGQSLEGFDVDYFLVVPFDKPSAEPQWLYMNALISDTALGILFDLNESLRNRAQFGVYNKNGILIVSNIQEEVKKGIASDRRAFQARKLK